MGRKRDAVHPRWVVYSGLLCWIGIYSLWNVIGRDMSEEGPVFKLPLFLWLRHILTTAVMFVVNVSLAGGLWRTAMPARADLAAIGVLGLVTWLNQTM